MIDEKVKDFEDINFGERFKCEEKNLRKVAESFYIFLLSPADVENYVELI